MIRYLIRLYPARWRARYGDEFAALLEERSIGPFDVADIVLGAIDARLRLRGSGASVSSARGVTMSLRIGGYAAMIAGLLLAVGLVGASGTLIDLDPSMGMAMFFLGSLALLVALTGLSAFQARQHPVLAWAAFAVPALGTTITLLGVIGMGLFADAAVLAGVSSWYLWFLGVVATCAGSGLFAIATYRTAALPRVATTMLLVGSLLPFLALIVDLGLTSALEDVLFGGAWLGFSLAWIVVGAQAVRLGGSAAVPHPV